MCMYMIRRQTQRGAWMRASLAGKINMFYITSSTSALLLTCRFTSSCTCVWVCSLPGPIEGHCISGSQVRNKRTEPWPCPPKSWKSPTPREQQFRRDCINDLAGRQAACNDSFSPTRFRPSPMSASNPALTLLSLSLALGFCYLGFCTKIHLFRAAEAHAKPRKGLLDLIPSAEQLEGALTYIPLLQIIHVSAIE